MPAQAGSLYTSLTLESSSFIVGLKKSVQAAERDTAKIRGLLTSVATAGKMFIGGAIAAEIFQTTKRALEYASSLGEVSQQLGVSSRALQEYRYIGSQVGIEQESMDKGLQKLTRTMGEAAAGAKKPSAAFKELGVDIRGLTAETALPKLADAFAKIDDPTKRARLEVALFGKTGQQLDTLLTQGAGGVDKLRAEAERLGIVLSDDVIRSADDVMDRFATLKQQLESQFARVVVDNTDLIMGFADALAWAADKAGELSRTVTGLNKIRADEGFWAGMNSSFADQSAAATSKGWMERKKGQRDKAASDLQWAKKNRPWAVDSYQAAYDDANSKFFNASMDDIAAQASNRPVTREGAGGGGAGSSKKKPRGKSGPTAEELATKRAELALEHEIALAEAAGDDAKAQALRDLDGWNKRAEEYQKAGLTRNEAMGRVMGEQLAIMSAQEEKRKKGVALVNEEFELQLARESGDWDFVHMLERQEWLRERIVFWQSQEPDLAKATARATEDQLKLDQARATARERAAEAAGRERQLTLAQMRGDSRGTIRELERDNRIADRRAQLFSDGSGRSEALANSQAVTEIDEEDRARMKGEFRTAFKDGFRSALDRDFSGWFENWWKERVSNALEDALNDLADLIYELFSKAGKKGSVGVDASQDGGSVFSTIAGLFNGGGAGGAGGSGGGASGISAGVSAATAALPGFATGGSFKIGGRSGIDQNLVTFRGTVGEHVNITKGDPALKRMPIELIVRGEEGPMFRPTIRSESAGVTITAAKHGVKKAGMSQRQSLTGR